MIQVVWEPPVATQQNGPILYYVVMVMDHQTRTSSTLNATSTLISVPSLHPAYNYSIAVAAVTINTGPYSRSLVIITPDDGELDSYIILP
jgi:hypothetical protein